MDFKAKKKDFSNFNIIKVGYCDLQSLLQYQRRVSYTAGVYGWNADQYKIEYNNGTRDVIICTGYRPFGNIQPGYEIIRKYEQKAKKIESWDCKYETKRKKVNKLLENFILEIMSND